MRNGFAIHAAEGVLGGAIGTLFLRGGLKLSRRLPEAFQMPELSGDPAEEVVHKIETMSGSALPIRLHRALVKAAPWAYGGAWGLALGVAANSLRRPRSTDILLIGAATGAAVWMIGYAGWLPASGLAEPLRKQGASHTGAALLAHIGFGVAAALPVIAIDALRRPRTRIAARLLAPLVKSRLGRRVLFEAARALY